MLASVGGFSNKYRSNRLSPRTKIASNSEVRKKSKWVILTQTTENKMTSVHIERITVRMYRCDKVPVRMYPSLGRNVPLPRQESPRLVNGNHCKHGQAFTPGRLHTNRRRRLDDGRSASHPCQKMLHILHIQNLHVWMHIT